MFSSDLFTKFSCTYCQEEISGVLTKCVECKDFALCLQCFAAGAEIGPHKNDHSYQFIVSDSDAQDLFKSKGGWSAREELLLLNGIEGFGFGNWKDIALKLENRTAEECKDEYIRTFLEGTIGRLTWPTEAERKKKVQDYGPQGSSTSVPQRMAPVDLTLEQAEILGYMINRDDFEKEYNNNAESIISQLNISTTEDDELDVALKLAQVDMYVDQLRERKRRKRIARDYQLITRFFNSLYRTKPANHEQAELEDKLRFLCQFLTCQEFDSFIPSWLRETGLRRRGAELSRYRQSGLTRYEEIPHFEQESIYRSDCKSSLLLNPNSSPGRCWWGAPALERAPDSLNPYAPVPCAVDPCISQPSGQEYSLPPRLSPHHHPPLLQPQLLQTRKSEENEKANCYSTGRSTTCPTDTPRSLQPTEQELQLSQPPVNLFKYTKQPSYLLSSSESQICASLDLTPSQYISIKTHLLLKCPESPETLAEKPIFDLINTNNWFVS